ncbi:hypothetical protein O7A70_27100 [Mesorhizobium sp. Cs1299R1N1]|uniref:hypothetical protein n=1 Tax=Mesorhizobium sp. Cs1299R1N1 TaxID=3015172 RepID=UPI00301D6AA5
MQHIAALAECRELQVPVSVFATADGCTAKRPVAMGDVQGQARHVVTKCVAVDPALEGDHDQIVWKVRPDGSLDASLTISDRLMASNTIRPEKDHLSQQ